MDELKEQVRAERDAMRKEARDKAAANKQPSTNKDRYRMRQTMTQALIVGRSKHKDGSFGKLENLIADRRRKSKAARKARVRVRRG